MRALHVMPVTSRGIDHIVHAVRDLERGAEFYRKLGFNVGPRNKHPWGTHNHIVQLPGFFIEILSVVEPEKFGADDFSVRFGMFNRDFLVRGEGFSVLILESKDVAADVADFSRHKIAASEVLTFERKGERPDGSIVTVGFSLAYASDRLSPQTSFVVSRQHNPDAFWNAAMQQHANGATGVAGIVLVAENPSDHHAFISAYTGVRGIVANSSGVMAQTARGEVQVFDPTAFRDRYGVALDAAGTGMRLAALRIKAKDLAAVAASLDACGVDFARNGAQIVVAPNAAMGATLIFEA
jgi:catechol 2,3-dioxygenase-like lactoylglutathione lyase family enzyme